MFLKNYFKCLCVVLLMNATHTYAQESAKWVRNPAISPDGSTIAFGYKGDIYLVPVSGGKATPLTIHEAHDKNPVWSPDGKSIAFASDRYGNFDVFVMPVQGGSPTRLTYHSASDIPQDFTPDGKKIMFTSARTISKDNIRFPSPRLFHHLYTVAVGGGRSELLSEAGMNVARFNTKGDEIVFQDRKGYEDPWRKHHTSSVTRDIWVYSIATDTYRLISSYEGEDLEPVFARGTDEVYYLSQLKGTLNVFKHTTQGPVQQTFFDVHPVRHLSIAHNSTLCFTYNGDLYTKTPQGKPSKIIVTIQNDGREDATKNVVVSQGVSQFALSPNGKEIAFINRGEVFVTSVEGTQTKRITNTPQQERYVQWAPDGRSIIYSAERNDSWDIYKASIRRADEPYFFASTVVDESPLIATKEEEFQAKYSPDGKEIAYISERNLLKIYNVSSQKSRTVLPAGHNFSYADGDWDFAWSPDSKYILCDDGEGNWFTDNVALIDVKNNGNTIHPMPSGYGQRRVKWAMGGKAMTWYNGKNGRKSHAYQGSREVDIYIGFYDQKAYDRFVLSKEEFALLEEKEKKEKEEKNKKDKENKSDNKESTSSELKDSVASLNLLTSDFKERTKRLTINSSTISDYALNPEGTKLYYLAAFEKGFDLWVTEPRTKETKILAKLGSGGSGIEMSKDGKNLFVVKDGRLTKIDENGKQEAIGISGEMILNTYAEREYILGHTYRQVQKKFYDPQLHGIDWDMFYNNYAQFLPHINNNYDFQELLSEFLGELNASHTGGRYSPRFDGADETASLGLLFDESASDKGLTVDEILKGGPFSNAESNLKVGDIIVAIDGVRINQVNDWSSLLNRKTKKNTLITFVGADGGKEQEMVIKPISIAEETDLLYKRWLQIMREKVNTLSGGKLGYVHVQGMNDASYRDVLDEVLGENYSKKGLIVDTRFNGGGWLHDDLKTFLSGVRYLDFAPQGNRLNDGEPMGRWTKPSCVLMSEGNYSDAFIFPYVYKQAGIGKLIGKPVPGTGTAVWWETQIDPTLVFGIPMIATIGKENRPTENLQLEPDIEVELPYADFLKAKDTQLEKAVQHMLQLIK